MSFAKKLKAIFKKAAANDNLRLERALQPPHDNTNDVLHGRTVPDPFRPLEKIDAPETSGWIGRQNTRFEDYISAAGKKRAEVNKFLTDAYHYDHMGLPMQYGDVFFCWRKNAGDSRYVYCLKPSADGEATPFLDPAVLDPSGKTDIVSAAPSRDGKYVAYTLSVSGSDAVDIRVRDVATGKDLPEEWKNIYFAGVRWDLDSKGFCYTQMREDGSKSNDIRHHVLGTPTRADTTVYSPPGSNQFAGIFRTWNKDDTWGEIEWISRHTGTDPHNGLLWRKAGDNGDFREFIALKQGGYFSPVTEMGDGKFLALTDIGCSHGRLVLADLNNPAPENWQVVLEGDKDNILSSAFMQKGMVFTTWSFDTANVMKVFTPEGKFLRDVQTPAQTTLSAFGSEYKKDSFYISMGSFLESGNTYEYNIADDKMTLALQSGSPIDLKDCIVERIRATSKDGTKVPMTVIRHPDTKLDGTAATILYGYGGFNVPLAPDFSPGIAQWVREGGIYVQSNLRGGGEFGRDWYDAGRLKNKQNVFDDFAACAEHLTDNAYTRAERLAIEGGSNGGLLTLATMLQRPELFGAVISDVPVTDMHRFHLGSNGSNWISDYGDPSIKDDFNAAAKYSPLHNVKEGFRHPPCLIQTDMNDDRVLPWHAYKMAATLQAKEDPSCVTLLKVNMNGGHGAGSTTEAWCKDKAETFVFLEKALGPVNQDDYKAQLAAEKKARQENSLLGKIRRKFGG